MSARIAAFLIAAAAGLAAAAPAQAASHYDCQIHGHRVYNHRHIDPSDTVVSCDRPQQTQLYPSAARCVAHARRRNGAGAVEPGTQMAAQIAYPPKSPAYIRADALNAACADAIEACYHVVGNLRDAQCSVIDRSFVD